MDGINLFSAVCHQYHHRRASKSDDHDDGNNLWNMPIRGREKYILLVMSAVEFSFFNLESLLVELAVATQWM